MTGANRGFGAALAQVFATNKWKVLGTCRNQPGLNVGSPPVSWLELDVTDETSIMVVASKMNGIGLDVLINNAALRGDTGGLETLEVNSFMAVQAVNVLGPLLMVKYFLPFLEHGKRKLIVNISSRAGSMSEGQDPDLDYAYRCSKAAINQVTVKLADQLDMTVLSIHPGWIKTDMGGPEAEIDPNQAALELYKFLDNVTRRDSGKFFTVSGLPIGW